MDITRKTLSAILNGRSGISPLMAIKLSIAFDSTRESWMEIQNQYDLWHAHQHMGTLNIKKLFSSTESDAYLPT